ncbi:MAG: hypothetical protein OEZ68_08780 [Gammaproteobacteria bacterium]|nr:hypothetical protein [Gammaproteobacteria bacterium]MDH5800881.1 hypothetical protein [Gammaproteobacteria bacterium]
MKKILLALPLSFAFIGVAVAAQTDFYKQNIELDGIWGDTDC